ncbi:FG-GAP repeat [Carpediemonas membranifera]|uniref:FG-GAP repeat n=1 Tax=Carpediemonas membranifera TaxID=201153 RepID=A0A8J6AT06_9EUKA|nr:FG-GAP repeat [Carpediemonas membranifera]|eukprot:KAG9391640.1 FG-GAP repeat [Carpediemonas membranifera]
MNLFLFAVLFATVLCTSSLPHFLVHFMEEITLPNSTLGDSFGASIIINKNVLYIGSPGGTLDTGNVYIYKRFGSKWHIVSTICPHTQPIGSYFGRSMALANDYLYIGQPDINFDTGSVSVFAMSRQGLEWHDATTIVPTDMPHHSYFGYNIDASGNTLIVGAYGFDSSRGMAVIYEHEQNKGVWSRTAELQDTWTKPGDHFGFSVAVEGDIAVVGSWCTAHYGLLCSGSAKVFERRSLSGVTDLHCSDLVESGIESWVMTQVLEPTVPEAGGRFGYSVKLHDTVIYASMPGQVNTPDGSVIVFTRPAGQDRYHPAQLILAERPGQSDDEDEADTTNNRFGTSLSVSPRGLIVGAPSEGPGKAGAVFWFIGTPGNFTQRYSLTAVGDDHVLFGSTVEFDGDFIAAWARNDDGPSSVMTYVIQ